MGSLNYFIMLVTLSRFVIHCYSTLHKLVKSKVNSESNVKLSLHMTLVKSDVCGDNDNITVLCKMLR